MTFLDLTFPTPPENLACDEALLDWFEENGGEGALRFWEPENYFVVVGYGNHVETEVNRPACEANGVPILRRCSGGGTVLQGPGCLNYSLILKIEEGGPLQSITSANRFIMDRNRTAVQSTVQSPGSAVEVCGHTDLTLRTPQSALKFSGNAQRRKKNYLLFHGTFLLTFDLPRISKLLCMPSKQPDYRENRPHETFVTNFPGSSPAIKQAMRKAWEAHDPLEVLPHDAIVLLSRDKYVTERWNYKF